jgi:hypothetical protein
MEEDMRIRKTALFAGMTLLAALLVLGGCNITINWPDGIDDSGIEPGIYLSLEWTDDGSTNPHLYLTYPAIADTTSFDGTPPVFTEPFGVPGVDAELGFAPEDYLGSGPPVDGVDIRGTVYFGNVESIYGTSTDAGAELVGDADGNEVILIREFPFYSSADDFNTSGGDLTGLAADNYAWVGIMEVYAYATSGQLATEGSADDVGAVLYVIEVDGSGNETVKAVIEVPGSTNVEGTSLLRINCFYADGGFEVYQFVPDVRVIQDDIQIRSVGDGVTVDENGIFTVVRERS